mgnify:CR=1 FL=1
MIPAYALAHGLSGSATGQPRAGFGFSKKTNVGKEPVARWREGRRLWAGTRDAPVQHTYSKYTILLISEDGILPIPRPTGPEDINPSQGTAFVNGKVLRVFCRTGQSESGPYLHQVWLIKICLHAEHIKCNARELVNNRSRRSQESHERLRTGMKMGRIIVNGSFS